MSIIRNSQFHPNTYTHTCKERERGREKDRNRERRRERKGGRERKTTETKAGAENNHPEAHQP